MSLPTNPYRNGVTRAEQVAEQRIDARDKEWAKWILDRLWDKCGSTAVVITEPADFEALKKLAESEK